MILRKGCKIFNIAIIQFLTRKDMSYLADLIKTDGKPKNIVILLNQLNNLHCVPALWLQIFAGAGIRKSGESPEQ